jgi:hypothetical protein
MNRPGSGRVRLSGVPVALLTVLPVFGVFSGSRTGVTHQVHGLNFSPYLDARIPMWARKSLKPSYERGWRLSRPTLNGSVPLAVTAG